MNSLFRMIDVGRKPETHRTAIAEGKIWVGEAAFDLIQRRALPKGDVLMLAEVAGIQGAKNASQMIPLCHPMGLDHVQVITELDAENCTVKVYCIATTCAKTGVEMEALAGVNAALLTIWDLSKMIEPALQMEGIRLLAKCGGKSGLWFNPEGVPDWVKEKIAPASNPKTPVAMPFAGISAVVIILSDRASLGVYEDRSGPVAKDLLQAGGAEVLEVVVLPDDAELLTAKIEAIKARGDTRLILTSGGTGIAPRDRTPETIAALADRTIPGVGELLRQYGSQFTPFSWSSRSIGATLGNMLIVTLPGNPKAVREGLECLAPQLRHLINTLDNLKHD
jgi:cyclic pyranopterin monophosphate synthase